MMWPKIVEMLADTCTDEKMHGLTVSVEPGGLRIVHQSQDVNELLTAEHSYEEATGMLSRALGKGGDNGK